MPDPHTTPAQPSRCPRGCLGPQQCLEKVTGRTYFDCLLRQPAHATPDRAATILMAWHDCGKVVAAMVSRPEWPEDAEHRADFIRRQAGRSITERAVSMVPLDDDWCRCFQCNHEWRDAGHVGVGTTRSICLKCGKVLVVT